MKSPCPHRRNRPDGSHYNETAMMLKKSELCHMLTNAVSSAKAVREVILFLDIGHPGTISPLTLRYRSGQNAACSHQRSRGRDSYRFVCHRFVIQAVSFGMNIPSYQTSSNPAPSTCMPTCSIPLTATTTTTTDTIITIITTAIAIGTSRGFSSSSSTSRVACRPGK